MSSRLLPAVLIFGALALAFPTPAAAQHAGHEGMPMPAEPPPDHSQMDHSQMAPTEHEGHGAMTGALGPYPMTREASGTAWQPDTSRACGPDGRRSGDWTLMAPWRAQPGLRPSVRAARRRQDCSPPGMLMGMARRPLGNGTLQFKAMLSPDPLMGKSGYPLLLASGETAERRRPADRPPASARFLHGAVGVASRRTSAPKSSVFLYAGLPGEPAFGPPAFMHREAIIDSPEAPISHHWLDSTHISFGVVTAGLVLDRVKLEVSRFNGREPDQHRWNIETGPLDSTAVRLSWNPTRRAVAAGQLGPFRRARAARAGRRPEALVGERALCPRGRARLEARRDARLGPQDCRRDTATTPSP